MEKSGSSYPEFLEGEDCVLFTFCLQCQAQPLTLSRGSLVGSRYVWPPVRGAQDGERTLEESVKETQA